MQGKFYAETPQVLAEFIKCGRVSKIIYSGWINDVPPLNHEKIIVAYNEDVPNPGIGNRNRQIKTSYNGLKLVQTKYAWKVRSDQLYPVESLDKYLDFFENHKDRDNKIFTPGLYTKEVFHIRDHMQIAKTSMVKRLWSCDYDKYEGPTDYNACLRAETYIVVNYLDFYSTAVMDMRLRWREYLLDCSPKRDVALAKSNEIMPKYFVPLPRVDFSWPKQFMSSYHYDYCAQVHGEYQSA